MINNKENFNVSGSGEITLNSTEVEFIDEADTEAKSQRFFEFIEGARKKIVLGVLEGNHQGLKLLDQSLIKLKSLVDTTVPGSASLVTQFFLPTIVDRGLIKTIEVGTKISTSLAKSMVNTGIQIFTFGTPAWLEAIRQHKAVSQTNEKIKSKQDKNLTPLFFIDQIKDSEVKKALENYHQMRLDLALLRENPTGDKNKLEHLASQIAWFEMNYKDVVDFSILKSIFEQGAEFGQNNEFLVKQLAEQTADEMIAEVENYYKKELGSKSDVITGKWLGIIRDSESGRQKLVEEIASRLKKVMVEELSDLDRQKEMKKVTEQLMSAFAVKRKYFKASIYSILSLIPIPQAPPEGYDSIWSNITTKIKDGLVEGWQDPSWKNMVVPDMPKISEMFEHGYNFIPSFTEYKEFALSLYEQSVATFFESGAQGFSGLARLSVDWVRDQASDLWDGFVNLVSEELFEKLNKIKEQVGESLENFSEGATEVININTLDNIKAYNDIYSNKL